MNELAQTWAALAGVALAAAIAAAVAARLLQRVLFRLAGFSPLLLTVIRRSGHAVQWLC